MQISILQIKIPDLFYILYLSIKWLKLRQVAVKYLLYISIAVLSLKVVSNDVSIPNTQSCFFKILQKIHRNNIVDISHKGFSRDILRHPNLFDSKKFYKHLSTFNTYELKGLLKKWYRDYPNFDLDNLIKIFDKHVGEKYIGLLFDPGIISRYDDFIFFAQKELATSTNNISLFKLRNMYKKKLGKTKLFRGMMLTDDELHLILNQGMESIT